MSVRKAHSHRLLFWDNEELRDGRECRKRLGLQTHVSYMTREHSTVEINNNLQIWSNSRYWDKGHHHLYDVKWYRFSRRILLRKARFAGELWADVQKHRAMMRFHFCYSCCIWHLMLSTNFICLPFVMQSLARLGSVFYVKMLNC